MKNIVKNTEINHNYNMKILSILLSSFIYIFPSINLLIANLNAFSSNEHKNNNLNHYVNNVKKFNKPLLITELILNVFSIFIYPNYNIYYFFIFLINFACNIILLYYVNKQNVIILNKNDSKIIFIISILKIISFICLSFAIKDYNYKYNYNYTIVYTSKKN